MPMPISISSSAKVKIGVPLAGGKVYTYAAAMEAGMTPETTIVDAPISWGG